MPTAHAQKCQRRGGGGGTGDVSSFIRRRARFDFGNGDGGTAAILHHEYGAVPIHA
jgi:hypothetical protein